MANDSHKFKLGVKRGVYNQNLKKVLTEIGLTYSQLAPKVGIAPNKLSQIVNFRYLPNEDQKCKIAIALSVPVDHIFPEKYDDLYRKISPIKREDEIVVDFVRLDSPEVLMLEGSNARDVEAEAQRSLYKVAIQKALNVLNDREKEIMKLRLQTLTYDEIAKKQNVTRERIRQIEAKAHEKLRNRTNLKKVWDYTTMKEK